MHPFCRSAKTHFTLHLKEELPSPLLPSLMGAFLPFSGRVSPGHHKSSFFRTLIQTDSTLFGRCSRWFVTGTAHVYVVFLDWCACVARLLRFSSVPQSGRLPSLPYSSQREAPSLFSDAPAAASLFLASLAVVNEGKFKRRWRTTQEFCCVWQQCSRVINTIPTASRPRFCLVCPQKEKSLKLEMRKLQDGRKVGGM